jgi:hypothetical protein
VPPPNVATPLAAVAEKTIFDVPPPNVLVPPDAVSVSASDAVPPANVASPFSALTSVGGLTNGPPIHADRDLVRRLRCVYSAI